jgi:hypothetical protein
MSNVEILAGALVLMGVYATVLQMRYSRLLKWAEAAQISLMLSYTILNDIKEEANEEPTDS